jgi:hypothetical protein
MSTIIKPRSADFEESGTSQNSQNLKFESEDWTSFRTVEGLQQKAGVAKDKLRRLVLKELTGNGLDEGGSVKVHIGELSGVGDSLRRTYSPEYLEPIIRLEAMIDARIDKAMARLVSLKEYKRMTANYSPPLIPVDGSAPSDNQKEAENGITTIESVFLK